MAKQGDSSEWKSSARGESAWKETREGVATRNAETRKSGKAQREGYEQRARGRAPHGTGQARRASS